MCHDTDSHPTLTSKEEKSGTGTKVKKLAEMEMKAHLNGNTIDVRNDENCFVKFAHTDRLRDS